MLQKKRLIPSPALGVALVALMVAMSGAAIALPGKGGVQKDDLAKGAVTAKAIAKNAVQSKNIKSNAVTGAKVKNGSLTAADVQDESLSAKDVSDYAVVSSPLGSMVRLSATDAPDAATGRATAPPQVLFKKGAITLYAKCFRDTGGNTTHAEIIAATSVDGSIMDGSDDQSGGATADFLNTTTLETDRQIETTSSGVDSASLEEGEFTVVGADGTHLLGQAMVAAKTGVLSGGNGVYGAGNVCLFGAQISG